MYCMDIGHQLAFVDLFIVGLGVHRYDRLAGWHAAEVDCHRVGAFKEEDEMCLVDID